MAGELLESTDATMSEIANQLGYIHQGDFTPAFRRWAAEPSSEFRRQRLRT
jgi:AraC-like DNA-binding protein